MSVQHTVASPVRVPVDLTVFDKPQSDLVRMALLLQYGHRKLRLEPDGSAITVELASSHRPIDVQLFVRSVVDGTS